MATKKENSPILIKDKDGSIKYTLEFTRRAVVFAERNGFILEDIPESPSRVFLTCSIMLFRLTIRASVMM